MIKKKRPGKDITRNNLAELIDQYIRYRQAQYDLFKQYNLCLQDPRFDSLYLDITCLEHYRSYIENDLNGAENYSSTTEIIKSFKKLLEQYDIASAKIEADFSQPGDTLLNDR